MEFKDFRVNLDKAEMMISSLGYGIEVASGE